MLFHCFVIKGSETWEKKLRPWFSTTAREFCDLPHFVPGVTIFNPLILFFCLIAQCIFVLWFSRPSPCFQHFQKTELMSRVCHPLMSSVFPATVDFVVGFCVYTAIVSSSFFFFFFLNFMRSSKDCMTANFVIIDVIPVLIFLLIKMNFSCSHSHLGQHKIFLKLIWFSTGSSNNNHSVMHTWSWE